MADLLADFFVFCDFEANFERPLRLLPCDEFNITHQIEDYLQFERGAIQITPVNAKHVDPIGLILRKRKSAEIYYSVNDQNTCHKRMVIAKELCHLVIKELDYDKVIDVQQFLLSVTRPGGAYGCYDTSTEAGQLEMVAHMASEQLLVPWFENDYIQSSSQSNYNIATKYRAPEKIIEHRKTDTSDEFSEQIAQSVRERTDQIADS